MRNKLIFYDISPYVQMQPWCMEKAANDEPKAYKLLFRYSQNVWQVESALLFSSYTLGETEAKSRESEYSGLFNKLLYKLRVELGPLWVKENINLTANENCYCRAF